MANLAVIFPGIGYHTDKPLLYFSKRLASNAGYEIISVDYKGFPKGVKGSPEKMKEAFLTAMQQTEEMLKDVDFGSYEDVIFISKSVGTAVAASYAADKSINARHIYYTPIAESFRFIQEGSGIAFHGTADAWADTDVIKSECERLSIPLYITPDSSHSLETGEVFTDLNNLDEIMKHTKLYIETK